ncbi:amidase [Kineobactrum salinum]|uniref:Amidase n=1 Tax=Kineobactrum salinum TaxID=2708301 RepID=A0A6C0U085_9GAMM|nr:amidase [Kineobactrum salinum]QIB65441.1 amidase [Kineobactrum salinum]
MNTQCKMLHHLSALELAERIRDRRLSAEEVTAFFLDRIFQYDEIINAFVFVDTENALSAAREVDRKISTGHAVGRLAGVPFGVKDFTHVKYMPTMEGSRILGEAVLQGKDDPVIERLRNAGAIPLGKTNVPEFGMHSATYNERFGITRNPWNTQRTPGGSSGGSSAAVAAGLVPFATGTDGGGSIRTPAAYCGLLGLKTTHGLIPSRDGSSLLSCLGFLTTTAADTAVLLDLSCGPHLLDRMSLPRPAEAFERLISRGSLKGLKAAWSPDFGYAPMEPEAVDIARKCFETVVQNSGLDLSNYSYRPPNVYRAWVMESLNFLKDALAAEGLDIRQLDTRTQGLLQTFSKSSAAEHIRMQKEFLELENTVADLFSQVDLLFTPATSCPAFGASEEIPANIAGKDATWTGAEPLSMFANIAGIPAISIPAGTTSDGLPVGLQIAARRHEDKLLLRLAQLMETVQPWPRTAPDFW